MSQAAALALSIVCAATITTGGILWSESRRAEPAPADPNAGEARAALERVEERLGSLEKRLASLEQRPAAPAQGEIQRSEASLSRREIEALVAEAVALRARERIHRTGSQMLAGGRIRGHAEVERQIVSQPLSAKTAASSSACSLACVCTRSPRSRANAAASRASPSLHESRKRGVTA
jgi:hypothetical protein